MLSIHYCSIVSTTKFFVYRLSILSENTELLNRNYSMNTTKLIAVLVVVVLGGCTYLYFSNPSETGTTIPVAQDQNIVGEAEEGEMVEDMNEMSDTPAPVISNPVVETPTPVNVPVEPADTESSDVSTTPEDNQSEAVDTTLSDLDTLFDDEYDDSEIDSSLEDNLNDSYDI